MLKANDSLKTISEIHRWLDLCAETYNQHDVGERITIDLSDLEYVSPIGCTTLLSTLRFLDQYFFIDTIAPLVSKIEEKNVVSYLERMNFFLYCPGDVSSDFENALDMDYLYSRQRNNKEDSLSEITVCNDDLDVERFDSLLKRILKKMKISPNRISNISRIVTELGLNSVEHGKDDGETTCLYCIQTYKSGKMEIAICDSGIGIVNSLKSSVKSKNHDDVVRQAILTKASRLSEQGRGKGLPDVKNVAFKLDNVEFYLRTHNSSYQIFDDKVELIKKGDYFFGTYYYLVIHT